jgi:hypothetical protein
MKARRLVLLAGTALANILLVAPQAAHAAGLIVSNGTVTNNLNDTLYATPGSVTVTIVGPQLDLDFTPHTMAAQVAITADPTGPFPLALSLFRDNNFSGNVSGTNGAGQTIAGFGIGLQSNTGGSVSMSNAGTITSIVNGVDLATTGGAISYSGGGSVTGASGIVTSSGSGGTLIATGGGAIKGTFARAIDATASSGAISIATGGTVTGGSDGISATATTGAIGVNITAGMVTGSAGNGIVTSISTGTATISVNNNGTMVSGTGAGKAGINAANASGVTNIIVGSGATVTDTLGSGVIATATASGAISINNSGLIVGAGTAANSVISITSATGTVSISNNGPGLIANNSNAFSASNSAMAISNPASTGRNIIGNGGTLIGAIALGSGANAFTNQGGGRWVLSDNLGNFAAASFGTGLTNTLTNNLNGTILTGTSAAGVAVPGSIATFTGLHQFNNFGTFYAGNSTTSVTTVNPNAGTAQVVTNTGTVYVNGTLNFANLATQASGSTFTNGSDTPSTTGTIDMSRFPAATAPDGTPFAASTHATTDKVTLGLAASSGTSDLTYTYNFGPAYNFVGANNVANNSVLNVDSLIYAPGSTSDRLIVSGTATGKTAINVWDTNANPAAYNPLGITVAVVNGSSSNAFFIASQTNPAHQVPGSFAYDLYEPRVGPMGAIKKLFFFYPLLQDNSLNSNQGIAAGGSRYALFSLPDIEAYQLPIAITAAQNIFHETASSWLDHQDEVRNWQRRGEFRGANASAGGAAMALKTPPDNGSVDSAVWAKVIGNWTNRHVSESVGDLVPAAKVIGPFDLGYQQSTYGLVGGVDGGRESVFNRYDTVVVGLMGGYLNSTLDFKKSPSSFAFNGGTAGASISYINGGWFADAMFKADLLSLKLRFPALGVFGVPDMSVGVTNLGGMANFGFRGDSGPWYVEPIVTIDYVRTKVGSYSVPGMAANFGDGESLRIGSGARFGVIWVTTAKYEVDSSVSLKVWDELTATQNVTLVTTGPDVTLNDRSPRVFGDISSQINITNKSSGWSAFMNGATKFGSNFTTVTGKGGVRYQF